MNQHSFTYKSVRIGRDEFPAFRFETETDQKSMGTERAQEPGHFVAVHFGQKQTFCWKKPGRWRRHKAAEILLMKILLYLRRRGLQSRQIKPYLPSKKAITIVRHQNET